MYRFFPYVLYKRLKFVLKQTNSYLMFMKITQIKIYLEYELGVNCFVNQTKRKMNYVTPIYYSRNNYFDSTKGY